MGKNVLCFDLGASSGRGIIAEELDGKLNLEEIHRFPNNIIEKEDGVYWDFDHLMREIKEGIKKAVKKIPEIASIGIDTWGCDYGWLKENGELLREPRCYRTEIPQEIIEEVHAHIPLEKLYSINGNAYFNFNSIYQIYNDVKSEKILELGGKEILFMPNLIFYHLTGIKTWEYSIASTSGLLNARERNWSKEIFEKLGIKNEIVGEIYHPSSFSHKLSDEIKRELGIEQDIEVSLVAGHDSACAVVGAPLKSESGYLINGTWSLLGVENGHPITDPTGIEKGIVNEGSVNRRIRFMNMMIGMWTLQRLKKEWNDEGMNIGFGDFKAFAETSKEEGHLEIDADFTYPENMENLIREKFQKIYGYELGGKEDVLRVAYNSMGNRYAEAVKLIEELSGRKIQELVLVGGGIQDKFLVDTVAKYTELPIVLGPIEASVVGNAIMQLATVGEIKNIDTIRERVSC